MLDQIAPEFTGDARTGDGRDFNLIVMGSGPAGQRAAIQAAKLGKRAAIIERRTVVGGACINTGTIPSKTLREAAMHLSGYRERAVYGAAYVVKNDISMSDLLFRADHVIRNEIDVTHHQLRRNGVTVIEATATFADAHTINLDYFDGRGRRAVTAERIVIAVGTETTRSPDIPFDGQSVFTSDDILDLEELPRTLVVIGAGVIGLEYATIFATLGVRACSTSSMAKSPTRSLISCARTASPCALAKGSRRSQWKTGATAPMSAWHSRAVNRLWRRRRSSASGGPARPATSTCGPLASRRTNAAA